MRIQSITPFRLNNFVKQNNQNPKTNYVQNNTYNPIAYNDLTFTARLCRTPEEFYSEPCNKHYMPETMKQYLNADFDDRKNMPPEQMLALVFDDINETKNLEQVKRIFSDEPLFENLRDVPNKKPRVGVLAEINLMKEDGKTLFKNGKDNLGHYILKKIYLEGKTLEEINADFKKDVSVYYDGLSPITYQDTSAFGIKFPNRHFWSSFVPHRRRFEPIKPRKPIERRNSSTKITTDSTTKTAPKQKNRFSGVKDWEIDSFSDALLKGNGSKSETVRRLKKSSVRDEASLGFVAKYMGEINSVVLEKLHISPEMSDFFENYDGLSKSQKQRLDDYWKNTDTKELRSTIMKDVIKLFFDAYGVDGQNDEFKELIEYAHSIKPNRIAQQKEHDRIQAEYDEMAEKLSAEDIVKQEPKVIETENDIFSDLIKKSDVNEYVFNTGDDRIVIVSNLKKDYEEYLKNTTSFLPSVYANKYIKFMMNDPSLTDSYMLTKLAKYKGVELPEDDEKILSDEDVININRKLIYDFGDNNIQEGRAAQQAVIDVMQNKFPYINNLYALFDLKPAKLPILFEKLPLEATKVLHENRADIDKLYNLYRKPLSNGEAIKISNAIIDLWRNYNPNSTLLVDNTTSLILYSISKYLNNPQMNKSIFRKNLQDFIMQYGGSARAFLSKDTPKDLMRAKFESFSDELTSNRSGILAAFATLDDEGFEYIRIHDYELYKILMQVRTI